MWPKKKLSIKVKFTQFKINHFLKSIFIIIKNMYYSIIILGFVESCGTRGLSCGTGALVSLWRVGSSPTRDQTRMP